MHITKTTKLIFLAAAVSAPLFTFGEWVDTNNAVVTNETLLGDIDMGKATAGDLAGFANIPAKEYTDGISDKLSLAIEERARSVRGSTNHAPATLTTNDIWICESSGEVLYPEPSMITENQPGYWISPSPIIPSPEPYPLWAIYVTKGTIVNPSGNITTNYWTCLAPGGPYQVMYGALEATTLEFKSQSGDKLVFHRYADDISPRVYSSIETVTYSTGMEAATNAVAAALQLWTTNMTVVGYTEWQFSGSTSPSATYTINMSESGGEYLFTLYDPSEVGSVTTNVLNPTVLEFSFTGGSITASRSEIRRNARGFAMFSDVQDLRQDVEDMDTSYFRFNHITNVNQSVQYVYTDNATTELNIQIPTSGMTKDWLVYVLAETNLVLHLPPASYWVANETVTNAIPSYTPTALYFTQVTEDTYSIGRKEFIPITVQTPLALSLQKARDKKRGRGFPSGFAASRPLPPAPKPAAPAAKPVAKQEAKKQDDKATQKK